MEIKELSIAAIRSLGIDMINKANSGHPGMVLGSAPALYTLFTKELNATCKKSDWINRDRFVLASGHASALLYTLLHLSQYDVTMDDLKQFRQWKSRTPGHPEFSFTHGVDASSGPLGQGIPTAVGMAMAEKFLATKYNKDDMDIIDHYTYVLCGDGDMQEGVTYEGASLAGHYSLGKLIVIYDSNDVTLDGPLSASFSEDVKKRFDACGWQVIEVADGNDTDAILKAIKKGKREQFKPTLIIMKTVIGYGSQNAGTNKVHGAPLGKEDGQYAKQVYGYDYDEFTVPQEVYDDFANSCVKRGRNKLNRWKRLCKEYEAKYPTEYKELMDAVNDQYTVDLSELEKKYVPGYVNATRNVSNEIINEIAKQNPTYLSGVADLASSTKTNINGTEMFSAEHYDGRNIAFGIREFAMVCILNGMTYHKGVKVSGGGFLVFSDYFKGAVRISALGKLPIILPLSHDSIAVGEDGPTHQPIEQMNMLRTIPNVELFRAADAKEMLGVWKYAVENKEHPVAIILTRQNVPTLEGTDKDMVTKGAYIVGKEVNKLDAMILATGSEVSLAMKAKEELFAEGIDVRVVSMPCLEKFDEQSAEYKESVLPADCRKRLFVEMGNDALMYKYIGLDGIAMSVDQFGSSAPADVVIREYGFTVENVKENVKKML